MPIYEYDCPSCGEIDLFHGMSEKLRKCPECGSKITRAFRSVPAGKVYGSFWEMENNGRGRFIDHLAKPSADGRSYDTKDKDAYCRSPQEAIEKGKKLGLKLKLA